MSYEHRGLVIGISGKLLYVLPIFSYNKSNSEHVNAYHPVDNPSSTSNFYLLRASEFSFLSHDSVLKLNDLRTVSVLRIKYKQNGGYIDQNSTTYQTIEKLVFARYFRSISYEYDQLKEKHAKLEEHSDELEKKNNELTADLDASTKKLASIKDTLLSDVSAEECLSKIKAILELA